MAVLWSPWNSMDPKKCFWSMPLLTLNHSFKICGGPETFLSPQPLFLWDVVGKTLSGARNATSWKPVSSSITHSHLLWPISDQHTTSYLVTWWWWWWWSDGAKDAACTWSLCSIRSGSTNCIDFPCPLESGPSSRFLGQPATATRRVAGTTHTQSGRRWEQPRPPKS